MGKVQLKYIEIWGKVHNDFSKHCTDNLKVDTPVSFVGRCTTFWNHLFYKC